MGGGMGRIRKASSGKPWLAWAPSHEPWWFFSMGFLWGQLVVQKTGVNGQLSRARGYIWKWILVFGIYLGGYDTLMSRSLYDTVWAPWMLMSSEKKKQTIRGMKHQVQASLNKKNVMIMGYNFCMMIIYCSIMFYRTQCSKNCGMTKT